MRTLGIIPARGGSKRIPGKNVKIFDGEPLLWRTLCAAENSDLDGYILTTDSIDILSTAHRSQYNFSFTIRPNYLARDDTPSLYTVFHALDVWVQKYKNERPDWIMILQPDSPFRTASHINNALDIIKTHKKCDTVVSVDDHGNYNGAVYLFRTELLFSKNPTFYGSEITYMVMNDRESISINTQEDWDQAIKLA